MNMHPVVQSKSSSNGYGRQKIERDTAVRSDSKFQTGKMNSGKGSFVKGATESPSRDRLIYLTTCLIGHQVEAQVLDGSIFSGIFHATNAEDFGIVLKMANLIKDGSRGQGNTSDTLVESSRTLIIPAKDLVQVIAKGVPVTRDGLSNEMLHEKHQELMTDSYISQSWHIDVGRELERWVPDENDPGCPELENIFDGPWNRGWDQFEANETLFGVKSTFNEEIYTTKLAKGPQMRELEREALRIAREIEGEETHDLHLAEERGIQLDESLEVDEETLYSSVPRGPDDSGYDDIEEILLDTRNDEIFRGVHGSVIGRSIINVSGEKTIDGSHLSSRPASMGELQSSLAATSSDMYNSGLESHERGLFTEGVPESSSGIEASRLHDNQVIVHGDGGYNKDKEKLRASNHGQVPNADDSHLLQRFKKEGSDKAGLSPNATSFDPPHALSKGLEKMSNSSDAPDGGLPPKPQGISSSLARPSSSTSSTSDRGGVTSTSAGRGSSPSSSVGSLSSEKSTLNPHAKEFKLNPNAKSFIPSQTPLRPSSPVADSSFYYPANIGAAAQMHGMSVGIGMGPFAAQQPVILSPQAVPVPQPYYHPNVPQYGQQMIIGQPRPMFYMPTYPPSDKELRGERSRKGKRWICKME